MNTNEEGAPAPKRPARKPRRTTSGQGRALYRDAALREGRGLTPDKAADYLALLSDRVQPTEAAKIVGVSMNTVREYRKKDPAFVEAEAQARADSVAPVVGRLYELAMEGHMTAILFLLQNADPDNWKDMRQMKKTVTHTGTVTHELDAAPAIERIALLQARLAERKELRSGAPEDAASVIDVEVAED